MLYPAGPEVATDVAIKYLTESTISALKGARTGLPIPETTVIIMGYPSSRFAKTSARLLGSELKKGFSMHAGIHARIASKYIQDYIHPLAETNLRLHGVSVGGPVVDRVAAELNPRSIEEFNQASLDRYNPTVSPEPTNNGLTNAQGVRTIVQGILKENQAAKTSPYQTILRQAEAAFAEETLGILKYRGIYEDPDRRQKIWKLLHGIADIAAISQAYGRGALDTPIFECKTYRGIADPTFMWLKAYQAVSRIAHGWPPDKVAREVSILSSHSIPNILPRIWTPKMEEALA